MKIKFVQSCTVYPEDKETIVFSGDEIEIADENYARLLIKKGHAVAVDKPAAKKDRAVA
jgi:hypothetical protein